MFKRTQLPISLTCLATLLSISAATLSTPALASKQSTVVAACKKMGSGCAMTTNGGEVSGCTSTVCFWCKNGKCVSHRQSAVGGKRSGVDGKVAVDNGSSGRSSSKPTTVDGTSKRIGKH